MKQFDIPAIEVIRYEYIDVISVSEHKPSYDDEGFNNEVVKP